MTSQESRGEETPPAQSLPGHTAGYHSDGVEVGVGDQVPKHSQQVADSWRVDVGLGKVGVDEVRQANQGVEEITEREVEDEDD